MGNETQITLKHMKKRKRVMKIKTSLIYHFLPSHEQNTKINDTVWSGSGDRHSLSVDWCNLFHEPLYSICQSYFLKSVFNSKTSRQRKFS